MKNDQKKKTLKLLKLADKIIKTTQKDVKTLHSIIRDELMPEYDLSKRAEYVKTFGADKANEYHKLNQKIGIIRDYLTKTSEQYTFSDENQQALTVHLATAMLGVGCCGESSLYAFMLLMQKEELLNSHIYLMLLENPAHKKTHCMIYCGGEPPLTQLTKESVQGYIFIDPMLGLKGEAKDYVNTPTVSNYNKVYNFDQIRLHLDKTGAETIIMRARDLAETCREKCEKMLHEIDFMADTLEWKEDHEDVFSQALVLTAIDALELDPMQKEKLRASAKSQSWSVLFRQSAAFGAKPVMEIFQNHHAAMQSFDISETSSNGRTARDWIEKAKYDKTLKNSLLAIFDHIASQRSAAGLLLRPKVF